MEINDRGITQRLEEIRRQVGVPRRVFDPPLPRYRVDKVPEDPEAVGSLFDGSGILTYRGMPVFVYIRDHSWGEYSTDPAKRRKIHFTICSTLREMKQIGRFERYQTTNRDDNRYVVDIKELGQTKTLKKEILYPCKNCLESIPYRGYNQTLTRDDKNKIVREFDAKEAFHLLWQYFKLFQKQVRGLRSANLPTEYTASFTEVSKTFRKLKKFTCDECGVNLSAHPNLVDTHHISGVKSDNLYGNLRCLCKLCHAAQPRHQHYPVSPDDQGIIEACREKQEIPNE